MPTIEQLLQGLPSGADLWWAAVLPAFLGLLLGGLGRRLGRGAAGAALGLGAGYLSTHFGLWGVPPLPPIIARDWLLVVLPIAVGAALWSARTRAAEPEPAPRSSDRWLHLAAAVVAVALTLRPRLAVARWSPLEAVGWTLGLGLPLVLAWLVMGAQARRRPERESLLILLFVTCAGSVAIGMSGSQQLAQGAGGVAAGLVALGVLTVRGGGTDLARGAAPVTVAVVGTLLLNANLYAELGFDLYLLTLASWIWALWVPAPWISWPGSSKAGSSKAGSAVGSIQARLSSLWRAEGPTQWWSDLLRALVVTLPAWIAAAVAVTRFQSGAGDGEYY
jgi:hypothetical protein